jgi:hypothetical protein
VVRPRRIAIVAVSLATASAAGWAIVEFGRPAEPTPVPPIVIELDRDAPVSGPGTDPGGADPGGADPGGADPEGSDEPGSTPGSGDGAVPAPAPAPPPAGDDEDDDGGDDDG